MERGCAVEFFRACEGQKARFLHISQAFPRVPKIKQIGFAGAAVWLIFAHGKATGKCRGTRIPGTSTELT